MVGVLLYIWSIVLVMGSISLASGMLSAISALGTILADKCPKWVLHRGIFFCRFSCFGVVRVIPHSLVFMPFVGSGT